MQDKVLHVCDMMLLLRSSSSVFLRIAFGDFKKFLMGLYWGWAAKRKEKEET